MIGIMLIRCVCCAMQAGGIKRMRSRRFIRKMDHDFKRYLGQEKESTDEQTDLAGRTSGNREDDKFIQDF